MDEQIEQLTFFRNRMIKNDHRSKGVLSIIRSRLFELPSSTSSGQSMYKFSITAVAYLDFHSITQPGDSPWIRC